MMWIPQLGLEFLMKDDISESEDGLPCHQDSLLHCWCQHWKCHHNESVKEISNFRILHIDIVEIKYTLICIFCFAGMELQFPEAHNSSNSISFAKSSSLTIVSPSLKWNPLLSLSLSLLVTDLILGSFQN